MEKKLKFIETSKLPTDLGEFKVHAFTDEKGNGCCYEKVVLPENWLL